MAIVGKQAPGREGLGLEYLDRLTLFDESFEYDGKQYAFASVQHVEYTAVATKHSINFIPTGTSYSTRLVLHLDGERRLHIKQERSLLNRKERSAQKQSCGLPGFLWGSRSISALRRMNDTWRPKDS